MLCTVPDIPYAIDIRVMVIILIHPLWILEKREGRGKEVEV